MCNRAMRWTVAAAIPAILAGAGCLKRHEVVQVKPSGAVSMLATLEGPKASLDGSFAHPTTERGWLVQRSTRKQGDEVVHVLEASAEFAPGASLPATFGDGSDVYLTFPTTLRVEKEKEGRTYHFRRVYEPRPFAQTEIWQDYFINDDIKALGEKDSKKLTSEEQEQLIRAFANAESHRQIELLGLAVDSAVPQATDFARLAGRAALLEVYKQFDYERLARQIEGLSEDEAMERIVAVGESVPHNAQAAYIEAFSKAASLDESQLGKLKRSIERETKRLDITKEVRGHAFRIEVALPGEIVAHNGTSFEDGRVIWEFDGRAICDRTFELVAISQVKDEDS